MIGVTMMLAFAIQGVTVQSEDWVSRHGIRLESDSDLTMAAKEMISKEVQGVQIVGLGETSHGVSEFIKMKSALIQHLVTSQKFSTIIIEATFGESVYLNQYISGERDDIDSVLKGMPLWFFRVEEFRDLLKWLRDFNAKNKNQVQLFGMEMQYVDRSLKQIKDYLDKVDSSKGDLWDKFGLDRIGSATAGAKEFFYLWQPIPTEAFRQHTDLLLELREKFDTNKAGYVAKSSETEYDFIRRHVVVLEQFISASMQSEELIKHQMRDYFMFLNVQWTRSHLGNPKTIVWAHNEHIWKQHGNGGYDVLGRQLDRRYGQSYMAIGFDFGEGTYRAPSNDGWNHVVPKPESGTLTHRMWQLGKPNYLLNIRSAVRSKEEVPALATLRASSGGYTPMQNGKVLYDQSYSLSDRYDLLVFVNKVTQPRMLK